MAKEQRENEQNEPTEQQTKEETRTSPENVEAPDELENLRRRLEEAQKSADSYKDQLLRKAAEFENFKRRVDNDFTNLVKNANEGLIISLLPILNDFVRSLRHGKDLKDYDAFYKGIEMIYGKLTKALESQGLVPFESVGKPFDVDFHDALLQIPRDDVPPHTVIEEVERGYLLNDRVLRHAKVVVSAPAEAPVDPAKVSDNA
jgi:molecular chaperone GrpE